MKNNRSKKVSRVSSSSSKQLKTAQTRNTSSVALSALSASSYTPTASYNGAHQTLSHRGVISSGSKRVGKHDSPVMSKRAFSTASSFNDITFPMTSSSPTRPKVANAPARQTEVQHSMRQSSIPPSYQAVSHTHKMDATVSFHTPVALSVKASPTTQRAKINTVGMLQRQFTVDSGRSTPVFRPVAMHSMNSSQITTNSSPAEQSVVTHQRLFATFKRVGKLDKPKAQEFVQKPKQDSSEAERVPTLNDVMRTLYKKIHPDLMMNYPEQKEQNEKSLTILQGFLSGLKDATGDEKYPMLRNASLIFFLRTNQPGHFQRVELLLHSDATLNRRAIEKQLLTFFNTIGIASKFKWDEEYFPLKRPPSFAKSDEQEQAEAEANEQSSGPHSNESYEEFMARLKRDGKKAETV